MSEQILRSAAATIDICTLTVYPSLHPSPLPIVTLTLS